ncbi:hypothetical protein JD844_011512 [Phrynosoma platyrhinos]|uniref:Spermatogenesis-associated protein 20 n=1 Tax=Phrynosoma platyrhinos TaxID=52577 RepID=A0ABQ7TI43_PHRPL|nr:hypothetical protein JD844_011512 [Phrynosoma platyrhinos]
MCSFYVNGKEIKTWAGVIQPGIKSFLYLKQISGDEFFADTVADILLYVSRDLSDKSGGFYSAEDADSYPTAQSEEKQEGAFCVWTAEEIRQLLPDLIEGNPEKKTVADAFMHHYGVKEHGNVNPVKDPHNELKGKNVLIVQYSLELTAARFGLELEQLKTMLVKSREKLYKVRVQRPRPHLDTKMLASWNGLMISGFAQSGAILGKEEYIDRAGRAADFLRNHMFNVSSGKLLRSCYRGQGNSVDKSSVPIHGFLEDYVFVIQALFDLYEASLNPSWLEWAVQLQHKQDELFWDPKGFAYFSTEAADPSLLLRMKDDQDGAEPSPNSIAVSNLLRAASYTGHKEWVKKAGQILAAFSERLLKIPVVLPEMACTTAAFHQTLKQVVICGDPKGEDTRELLHCYYSTYTPHRVRTTWKDLLSPSFSFCWRSGLWLEIAFYRRGTTHNLSEQVSVWGKLYNPNGITPNASDNGLVHLGSDRPTGLETDLSDDLPQHRVRGGSSASVCDTTCGCSSYCVSIFSL